ncbi:MAG: hypothetical protein J1E82_04000 [Muribaculaceae bacterium]|nr:hypothetical protein [Muribaculaceae bacterium]
MVLSIIFGSLLFLIGLIFIPYRLVGAPCSCFLGLLIFSMGKTPEGYPMLPLGTGLVLGWLFMSVFITILTLCQPAAIRNMRKGMYYYLFGALTGMAVGLLGFTFAGTPGARYAIMIVATAVGVFLGAMMYASTPDGRSVNLASGHFFSYFMAKGFPTAISVMQLGTVLVVAGI